MIYLRKLLGINYATCKNYINYPIYISTSTIGNVIDNEGYIGPTGGGGISLKKQNSILKSFSEAVERRSLLFGAKEHRNKFSQAFDLVNNCIIEIPSFLTLYHKENPIVDTTGTAVHYNINNAIYNALTEVLEKNSTFLFWYGKKGYKLNCKEKSFYTDRMKKNNVNISFFVQDFFYPLIVVFCVCEDKISNYTSFGIGSGFTLDEAIEKARAEAYFLKRDKSLEIVYNLNKNVNYNFQDSKHLKSYMKFFEELDDYIINENSNELVNIDERLRNLIENFPAWIQNIYVVMIKQKINHNLSSVKVMSENLICCVPSKKNLNLKLQINQQTINLDEIDLTIIPECPIL